MIKGKTILEIDNAIYDHLKNKQPDIVFGVRIKNDQKNRFSDGFRFRGNDDYISIGLVKTNCAKTHTSAIHIDFKINEGLYLNIVVDGVNTTLQTHYINIANKIGCTLSMKSNPYRYEKQYCDITAINSISDLCNKIDNFLKGDYITIKNEITSNCPDELWSKTEFEQQIQKTDKKRQTLQRKQSLHQAANVTTDQPNDDTNLTPTTMNTHPLNLILYGPPGTGKTYNTVNEALDIIKPKWREEDVYKNADNDESKRKVALDLFNQYKEDGQIVFTTFHQSLSYEEFIEGIKPIPPKDQANTAIIKMEHKGESSSAHQFGDGTTTINGLELMTYDVVDGIFKMISKDAEDNLKDASENNGSNITIQELLNAYCDDAESNNKKLYLTKDDGSDWHEITPQKDSNSDVQFFVINYGSGQHLTRAIIERDWNDFLDNKISIFSDIKPSRGNNKYHGNASYYFALYKSLKKFQDGISQSQKSIIEKNQVEQKNYVLIIDEINRGNVSQIFGELITLIEEDKRTTKWDKDKNQYVDNPEKITVKLPYSPDEKPFGVPGNLYIIGTMNTADRSVEALDTALRRRFDFKEMMPKPELVNGSICGYDLKDILNTINERIRVLKDREHQIGHSYFMKCKTEEDLKNVFKNNIVPLLQEYFYGNYAYIGLVLGNEFVKKEDAKPKFASLDGYTYDSDNEPTYRLLTDDEWEELKMNNALDNLKVNKSDTSENVTENEQLS